MDTNAEALKIAKNLTPIIEQVTYRMTENCMRSKLYTVSSVPSGGKIGVKDAFDEVEMQVPYSSALSKARVGDAVWCVWMGSNQSTMVAMWEGDLVSTSETDAILHVVSPANSVVTITKGSYRKSSGGSVNQSDPTLFDYYFTIHWWQQDSTPWTVTATRGGEKNSDTIIIDTASNYDMTLMYGLYLYRNGIIETTISGGLSSFKIYGSTGTYDYTNADNELNFRVTYSSGTYGLSILYRTENKVDITKYSTLHMDVKSVTLASSNAPKPRICILTSNPSGEIGSWSLTASTLLNAGSTETEYTLDVSAYTGEYYVGLGIFAGTGGTSRVIATQWWLT